MLKSFARLLVVALFVVPVLAAEDLSGKWSGSFIITVDGNKHDDVAYAVFKHKDMEFSGSIGPNADEQFPLIKPKLTDTKDGLKIAFDVAPDGGTDTVHFELIYANGHIKGKAKGAHDGHTISAEVDLQRAK